jgi:hypothetical protein
MGSVQVDVEGLDAAGVADVVGAIYYQSEVAAARQAATGDFLSSGAVNEVMKEHDALTARLVEDPEVSDALRIQFEEFKQSIA